MNEIQKEIKYYEKLMGEYADGIRSVVKTSHGVVQKPYAMAATPAGVTTGQRKRFEEIVKVWKEINGWRVFDADRAAELRSRIAKLEELR